MRTVVGDLTDGRRVTVAMTERSDGDFAVGADGGLSLSVRTAIVDRPWIRARQVHGAEVLVVGDAPSPDAWSGRPADALVTRRDDVVLEVRTADCVALALWTDDGVMAAVHCGWRGLQAGVLDAAVDTVRVLSDAAVHAAMGPSIGAECYEFGADDLRRVVDAVGEVVVAETPSGRPSLDVRAGVRASLDRLGVGLVAVDDRCTACEGDALWSHRARSERERQALAVWIGPS